MMVLVDNLTGVLVFLFAFVWLEVIYLKIMHPRTRVDIEKKSELRLSCFADMVIAKEKESEIREASIIRCYDTFFVISALFDKKWVISWQSIKVDKTNPILRKINISTIESEYSFRIFFGTREDFDNFALFIKKRKSERFDHSFSLRENVECEKWSVLE